MSRKIGKEFYLDWEKDTLQVWEFEKSRAVVVAMCEGVRLKHPFPSVSVFEVSDNFYRLTPGDFNLRKFCFDGGHNRSLAHYLENAQLLCIPVKSTSVDSSEYKDISNMWLGEKVEIYKLKDALSYLPRNYLR